MRAIEVGNIFQLGQYYSKLMNATFTDKKGKDQYYYMGCYGIGVDRTLATIVEAHHDAKGIIWPEAIAPFKVHLIDLGQKETAARIYQDMTEKGIEVLYDDREDKSAGEKFADADLIGIPYRVVVSEKTLKDNSVEIKKREESEVKLVKISSLTEKFHAQ